MKRKILLLLLSLFGCLVLSGCLLNAQTGKEQYTATFFELFDTVITVTGREDSSAAFQEKAAAIRDDLWYYHQLFDIYHDYEGVANIKTINDNAGVQPVTVDPVIIALLQDCKAYYELTGGKVNVAMGGVLKLWHEARNGQQAKLPDREQLMEAAAHASMDSIVINEEDCTVFITDPLVQLDVGAVAKGWATQRVAEKAPAGLLLNIGGNICATGPKTEDGTPWIIGVQDPDNANQNLHTLYLTLGSAVTSGDYQRYFVVDGEIYHHIIDPETLMPATGWRSVTVLCEDSGLADALSTGLFLLDLEQGKQLVQKCEAEAMWVDQEGNKFMTEGFESKLRN